MLKTLFSTTRIPVPQLRDVPVVAESEALGIKIDTNLEAAKAEVRRIELLRKDLGDAKSRAERIAAGETLPPPSSLVAMREAALASVAENTLAKELHTKNHAKLLNDEGMKLRQSLKATCDPEVKRFAAALAEAHSALCVLERIKNDLVQQGLGWYSVPIAIGTDYMFGSPLEKSSDIAFLLRDLVKLGYLSRMPEELR